MMHPRKSGPGRRPQVVSCDRHRRPRSTHLRDFSGAKLARLADDGKCAMQNAGGLVSQMYREIQIRNYQGA
jgi:hypothetical protein